MHFYALCIIVPALVGVGMYALRPSGVSVDTDAYLPFFSVVMALWGVLFLVVSIADKPNNIIILSHSPDRRMRESRMFRVYPLSAQLGGQWEGIERI